MSNREQMAARFKPGGDKYESIKADEQWEKVEAERERCTCPDSNWASLGCPLHGIDLLEGVVDISEE